MSTTDLVCMIGIPGSGKSTQAKLELNSYDKGKAVIVSRDTIRDALFGTRYNLSADQENLVTIAEHNLIDKFLEKDVSVISDNQNLRMDYRKKLAQLAAKHGATYRQVDLTNIPLDRCLTQNEHRGHPVPTQVIYDAYNRYVKGKAYPKEYPGVVEPLKARKPYVAQEGTPKAIMVDIDGTVALCEGVRNPYDTSRYHLDKPNWPVIEMVQKMHYDLGYKIVFCSGRHRDFFNVTYEWLMEYVKVPVSDLIMRRNPATKDHVEKLDLFDDWIRDHYDVRYVFDDRNRVVEAWRSIGLTVFQVNEGDF